MFYRTVLFVISQFNRLLRLQIGKTGGSHKEARSLNSSSNHRLLLNLNSSSSNPGKNSTFFFRWNLDYRTFCRQQQSPRSPPTQNQNSFPVHIEIRTVGYPPDALPAERNPNAVYVTQPIVLQHPGNRVEPPYKGISSSQCIRTIIYYAILGPTNVQPAQPQQFQQARQPVQQQQSPKVDGSGARIIPIQIEGKTTPSVPAGDK